MATTGGVRLVDKLPIIWATEPKNWTGAASTSVWINCKTAQHLTFIIFSGAWAGGTAAVTLNQATDVSGTSSKALAFTTMFTNTANTASEILTQTAVVSNTFNLDTANAIWVIEVDPRSLDINNSFVTVQLAVASPGANADIYGAIAIGSIMRYYGAPTTTMPTTFPSLLVN